MSSIQKSAKDLDDNLDAHTADNEPLLSVKSHTHSHTKAW